MKTNELTGAALDWAVAQAEGLQPHTVGAAWWIRVTDPRDGSIDYGKLPQYSTDWVHGGPIIEREGIALDQARSGGKVESWIAARVEGPAVSEAYGPTPLVAAMRCYVASCLGDEIELPEEI